MAKIEVEGVYKIFGSRPERVLDMVHDGVSKEEIRERTGHTVGLRDVTLSIEASKTFVVMGLSGCGKSTLIRHLNRLIDPTLGAVTVGGVDILSLNESELIEFRRQKVSMVFQRFGLFPHRTVLQNVGYGLEVQGIARDAREQKAREWIDAVGLGGYEDCVPAELSGGMQQRVGLARALATDADILLMDEPFSALDPLIRRDMQEQLVELQNKLHKTIVFITHDLDEALRLGDRIAILKDGEVVQVGDAADILLRPATDYVSAFIEDVYRGRVLTAATVMSEAGAVAVAEQGAGAALAAMQRSDDDVAYVVDRERRLKGVLSADGAERAAQNGGILEGHLETVPAVSEDTVLDDLLALTLETDWPIAVVEDDGTLTGVVSQRAIIAALADA